MTVSESPPAAGTGRVCLADGVELVGEFAGSGYREPPRLVYRDDGQVVRLTPLLYLTAEVLDEQRRDGETIADDAVLAEAAAAITKRTGRDFTGEHVAYLCDRKLAPLGVSTYSDGSPPAVRKADPFLALRLRVAVLPARATWVLGGALLWLFQPAAIAVVLLAAAASEVWAFGTQHPAAALEQTIMRPAGILTVLGLVLASTAFHEIGHATACRYGGARPGTMGCGVYLVWPAFYTDITDTYRLGRAGRLRADLGGVYFNTVFLAAMTLLYAGTGYQPLLVAVLMINLEIIQQLLPTLRFDGYYIVADLVGIPDLFTYIGAILRRTILRRTPDARLTALKHRPQTIVTAWVLIVIPVLLIQLGYLITRLPHLIRTDLVTIHRLITEIGRADHPALAIASAAVQVALLVLPIAGVTVVLTRFARAGARLIARRITRRRASPRTSAGGPRPWRRGAVLALAAVTVLAGAAWTLATDRTPGHVPVAVPTHAPTAHHPAPRPSHHPSPSAHHPTRPPPQNHPGMPDQPNKPSTAPGHHHAHTPARPGTDTPRRTHEPQHAAPHEPAHSRAPGRSPHPTHSPTPTPTCKVRIPLLPIGLGCD